MNRTALCIKMLQILNAKDLVLKSELAQMLETNVRNISEFKKELEIAGYQIETVSGRYGGYRLVDNAMMPAVALEKKEIEALDLSASYLSSHNDFLSYEDFEKALIKIKAAIDHPHDDASIYYKDTKDGFSENQRKMIQLCDECRKQKMSVEFEYKSMNSSEYKKVRLQPYEILNIKGEYYCLGYNTEIRDFRNYKFSEARMRNIRELKIPFTRDLDFELKDHIGYMGLMKDDLHMIDCVIHGKMALLVFEKAIGMNPKKEWLEDGSLHLTTAIEGKIDAMQFLLSLGSYCHLNSPDYLKKELFDELESMKNNYK